MREMYEPQILVGDCREVLRTLPEEDGWFLRADIIWHKPNIMPSSVQDRPTIDYEHVFLLSKSRKYYYDNAAIREPVARASKARYS